MTEKIKLDKIVVVEGKYDAIKLDNIIDGIIIPVNGFAIFKDYEKKQLLKQLGEKYGIILFTDSDTAGFKIRTYIQNICKGADITNVYIPTIIGKEHRKQTPSKEGYLGVEGVKKNIILKCLSDAGVMSSVTKSSHKSDITYTDLFRIGLSGTENSSLNRKIICDCLQIPFKLSKKSFLEVLNRMTTINEIETILNDKKPTLFWDFHGTLTVHLHQWVDCAYQLITENFPEIQITVQKVEQELSGKCLPWYTYPSRDTRHLIDDDGWWKSCNQELFKMFVRCGLSEEQAQLVYTKVKAYLVDPVNNPLYDDTKQVLQTLTERGYKHYLISNNFPELDVLMDKLALTNYFEKMIISGKIGYDKPRKEIFEYARKLAGSPPRCVMIGDNVVDDIQGGKSAGFETIWIDLKGGRDDSSADYIVTTLSDILNILK